MDKITENRHKVVQALVSNPFGFEQIKVALSFGTNSRCALGVACHALGIDTEEVREIAVSDGEMEIYGPYEKLREYLDVDEDLITSVWTMNDSQGKSYREIGEFLEHEWFPQ